MEQQQIRQDRTQGSRERTEEEQEQIIRQLKDSIQLSHSQIHKLLLNEQAFIHKISLYSNTSKDKINQKSQLQISQALVYLSEAQKILEYAASCGKNINRELIICVLHNQACVYQILWQLQECSNYLQALIYNYETFFRDSSQFSLPPSCIYGPGSSQLFAGGEKESYAGGSEISHVSKVRDPRMMSKAELKLLNYYFEHCAVSSQLQQNRKALQSAKKGIKLLKNSLIQHKPKVFQEMCSHKTFASQNPQHKYFLLQQLSEMSEKIPFKKIRQVTKAAHYSLQIWSSNRSLNCQIHQNNDQKQGQGINLKDKLKDLAIGTIMQIVPVAFDKVTGQAVEDDYQQSIFSMEEYILRVFFLSVGYFSVATQLRLLSNSSYKGKKQQQRKNSPQFKQSMLYHLIAIIIASLYIPYQCRYITDILASYAKHYSCNLEEYKPVDEGSLEKVAELLGVKLEEKKEQIIEGNREKMTRSTKQSNHLNNSTNSPEKNQYHMNCKTTNAQIKSKLPKKKLKEALTFNQYSQQPSSPADKLKNSKIDLKSSQVKKSRADSKTSRSRRSGSKHSVNIKDKIQRKYSELQKILSTGNLIPMHEEPKTPSKKLKTEKGDKQKEKDKQKQREKSRNQVSRDNIKVKKTTEKDKDELKYKTNGQVKQKTQRKTKNSEKREEQKQKLKPNTITEEDEFFFYMTKKTTKTTNNNMLSPKDSIKSIGSSRRSANKKSSMQNSRSKSKSSPRVIAQSPITYMQSSVSQKGLGNIKRIVAEKKSPTPKIATSLYKNSYELKD